MNFEPIVSVGCSMHNLTVCAPCQVADQTISVFHTAGRYTLCALRPSSYSSEHTVYLGCTCELN